MIPPGRFALVAFGLASLVMWSDQVRADLPGYLERPEPSYAWELVSNHTTDVGTVYSVALTSQDWRGTTWTHGLRVYEPAELTYPDVALLFITGGAIGREPKPDDHELGFGLARLCGARVAVLPQVPNQPLMGGKVEDDLIAETFINYLASGEEDWPLLQPMVKSAIAAMNAVQELGEEKGKPVKSFVVTGASKRGWTTWLTTAMDERVIAAAPMVIPTLNLKAQSDHQLEVWGKYSEQIGDYVSRGLMEQFDTPRGKVLWTLVDPFSYLDRIKVPVLQINSTNDRYWTLDSMNVYWDDITAPKSVVYLPNAGHNMAENRDYALNGVAAWLRHAASGTELPALSWTHDDADNGELRLTVESSPAPKAAQVWVARSETKDFREVPWTATPAKANADGPIVFVVPRPVSGSIALIGDLTYEIDGLEYHLSTQVRQVDPEPTQ